MAIEKRSRGRPRGSGKKDTAYLEQVADLIVRDPSLKPTTAMKRIRNSSKWDERDDTILRRWQVKWKEQGEALMAAARERTRAKTSSDGAGYSYYPLTATQHFHAQIDRMMADQRRMQDLIDPPHMRMMREQMRMQDLIDPPHMREFRRIEELLRRMRDPFG